MLNMFLLVLCLVYFVPFVLLAGIGTAIELWKGGKPQPPHFAFILLDVVVIAYLITRFIMWIK